MRKHVTGTRRRMVLAVAFAVVAGEAGTAAAQVGPPTLTRSRRPTVSPYINLLNNNFANPALGYYGQVRPQNDFLRANARQRGQIRGLQQQLEEQQRLLQSPESALGPTGHRTSFMNYGSYFPAPGTAGRPTTGTARRR